MTTTEFIKARSKTLSAIAAIAMVILMGFLDYINGVEVSFGVFYLLPILFATWFSGTRFGIFIAILCTVMWHFGDSVGGQEYSSHLIPYWNILVRFGFFIITLAILHKLKLAYARELLLSRSDPLTGAANRRYFCEIADMEIERSHRYKHPISAAYIDIDNFKAVNDRFGHHAGDALLTVVAEITKINLRHTDTVARVGGDEFAVLLPETEEKAALTATQKIQTRLLDAMREKEWPATFSIGVVTFKSAPSSVDEMIKKADGLMYSVKSSSKNAIRHEIVETSVNSGSAK